MNDLLDTFGLLAAAMLDDPLLTLANAVTWLYPLWDMGDEDVYEEGDGVGMALCMTRSAFPDIYAGAVERIRSGAGEKELDSFISGEISQRGIPLDNLEYMGYGIPLNACGIELSDLETYIVHTDLLPILTLFGIEVESAHDVVDIPDCACTAGRMLADSLVKQVGWSLGWLFSCTGNTLLDFDQDALAEIQPLSWNKDDLDFAIELIEEADEMMMNVSGGLKWLGEDRQLFDMLAENVKRTYSALDRQSDHQRGGLRVRLLWH